MKTTSGVSLCVPLLFAAWAAWASPDEERLLASLKKAYPGTQFTNVSRTPVAGLYEVWMGSNVAFVSDKDLRYLVFGRLFDGTSGQDLTAAKLAEAERRETESVKVSLDQLPLADAIKTVRGDGSRVMAVFSDPGCPYCRRLEPELSKLDNVTIYTFLLPFQGAAAPAAIWCAADREVAWRRYMLDNDSSGLSVGTNCANPLDRNLAMARRLAVRGTPTIFFADGGRLDGYTDVAQIEVRLSGARRDAGSTRVPGQKEKL